MSAMNFSRVVDLQRYRRESVPALITTEATWTYGQLADSVAAFAAYLAASGVGYRDRVALLAMNSAEYVVAVLAIYRVGAIAVPLNYRLKREELDYLLQNSESIAIVGESEFVEVIDELTLAWPLRARVLLDAGAGSTGWRSYAEVMHEYAGQSTPVASVAAGDIQRIMYTSGTTSRPKGVLVTHEMAAYNVLAHTTELELTSADRVLVSSPLYHVAAWDSPGVGVLYNGGSLVIMRRFDAPLALQLIEGHEITGAHLVQAIVHGIRATSDGSHDLSSLRWIIIGGIAAEMYDEIQALLPTTRLVQGYGMTEACSAISYIDAAHARSKLGSVGTAVPFVEFRVVDEADADTDPGVQGEVLVRGPKVSPGYWADEELTTEMWRGGWLHTGDAGVIDADGYLSITDRLKEMIKSGGENVASPEIERVLYRHPAVAEVAVIGVPDPRWQEVPKAFVVRKAGATVTEPELIAHCRSHLASFKTPKSVEFVTELPRNASGKVLKRTLREMVANDVVSSAAPDLPGRPT
jgi:acyl-CoA synthetase (AMP-forming)/AMP-acid ligase II